MSFRFLIQVTATLLLTSGVGAQTTPKEFDVPKTTLSPDKKYGVTIPVLDQHDDSARPKNSVIEVKTGKVLAVIEGETGWDRQNHGGVLPCRWSGDGSLLLWEVDGKWSPNALVLLKLKAGKLDWQTNILKIAQREILARTKRAAPLQFAKTKKANAGNGLAYPEGFTVDVEAINPIALPVRVRAALTSNPKRIEDFPTLDSSLEGLINERGGFVVTDFRLGRGHSRHF